MASAEVDREILVLLAGIIMRSMVKYYYSRIGASAIVTNQVTLCYGSMVVEAPSSTTGSAGWPALVETARDQT